LTKAELRSKEPTKKSSRTRWLRKLLLSTLRTSLVRRKLSQQFVKKAFSRSRREITKVLTQTLTKMTWLFLKSLLLPYRPSA
jgi:hypothetical protein